MRLCMMRNVLCRLGTALCLPGTALCLFGTARCLALFLSLALLSACGAPKGPYRTPDHWQKSGYEWPPGSGKSPELVHPHLEAAPAPARAKTWPDHDKTSKVETPSGTSLAYVERQETPEPVFAPLEKGDTCLRTLAKKGVDFIQLPELLGVENPVEIRGLLATVEFWSSDRRPLHLDCRLALALADLRPVFQARGITRVRFSGAYSYRRTPSGRLSHHAHGLAIDIHELSFGRESVSVDADFMTNVGCQKDVPRLNEIACAMRDTRMFEEFLTPDYNSDHRDHLHISVPRRKT